MVATASALASRSPRQMVLRLSDMPTGFKVDTSGAMNAAAAVGEGGVTLAELKSWGYRTGYETDFASDVALSDSVSGAIEITSSASIYASRGGVAASLDASIKACGRHKLSVGATIGDQAELCAVTQMSGGYHFQAFAVLWRQGAVKGAVIVVGLKGGVSSRQAVSLAKVESARIG